MIPHASKRRGFSLVELMVVIAIVALLVAALLPALSEARATAQSVNCMSRQRQFGIWMTMYANAYNQQHLWANMWESSPVNHGDKPKGNFVNTLQDFADNDMLDRTSRSLSPQENFWLCPGNPYRPSNNAGVIRQTAYISWGWKVVNYHISCYYGYGNYDNQTQFWWTKRGEPNDPARQAMLAEGRGTGWYWGYYSSWNWGETYFHPNSSNNVLMADGHAINLPGSVKDHIGDRVVVYGGFQ